MTEQEIRVGQVWRRVKGVKPGTLVRVAEVGFWGGVGDSWVEWRGIEGGRGNLFAEDLRNRYEFVKEASE